MLIFLLSGWKNQAVITKQGVTETVIIMGYRNISHFRAAFKKQFGVLPKQVRRQCME